MSYKCNLCPRNCGALRKTKQGMGYCQAPTSLRVGYYGLHHWEEPPISGNRGSGTIFFSHCSLKCDFCQNHVISHSGNGKFISQTEFISIFLELKKMNAHNINLVTPTHYAYEIIKTLQIIKKSGFELPIIYNTGSYDRKEIIERLEGLIDIYIPDLKFFSSSISNKFSNNNDYFKFASESIKTMILQIGSSTFDTMGIMKKGIIIRHLVLPGCTSDSKNILSWIHDNIPEWIQVSIMSQFTPLSETNSSLNRKLTRKEYDRVLDHVYALGIKNIFTQRLSSSSQEFIPAF